MRVFCPSCQEPVTIADDLAGKATFCPLCKAAFTAPTLFISPAPAASGYPMLSSEPTTAPSPTPIPVPTSTTAEVPRREPLPPLPAPDLSPRPAAPGSGKTCGFVIPLEVVQWLAPVCLVLAVFLTFFSWNGAYPAGHAVYTQSAWGALFGNCSTDPVGDNVLKLDPEKPADNQPPPLRKQIDSNLLLLPFLPLLILAAGLAIAFTIYPMLRLRLPPQLEKLIPWRMAIIAALALLLTALLALLWARGFGLENALTKMAKAELKDTLPERPTDEQVKTYEIKEAQEVGKFRIRHTWCLRFTLFCLIGAVVGAGLAFATSRRGHRTGLRVDLTW